MIKTRLRGFSKSSGARKGIKAGKKPTNYLRMSRLTRPLYFSMYFALAFYLILHKSISIHQAGSELPPFICLQMEPRLRCVFWSGPVNCGLASKNLLSDVEFGISEILSPGLKCHSC